MPNAPRRRCEIVHCPNPALPRRRYCSEHYIPYKRPPGHGGTTAGHIRGTARWQRLRARTLRDADYICHYCGQTADTVDHVIALTAPDAPDPYDESNLVAACRSCNSRKGGAR